MLLIKITRYVNTKNIFDPLNSFRGLKEIFAVNDLKSSTNDLSQILILNDLFSLFKAPSNPLHLISVYLCNMFQFALIYVVEGPRGTDGFLETNLNREMHDHFSKHIGLLF
jgi:hypothetical protein